MCVLGLTALEDGLFKMESGCDKTGCGTERILGFIRVARGVTACRRRDEIATAIWRSQRKLGFLGLD
jgi:hypothetical protein